MVKHGKKVHRVNRLKWKGLKSLIDHCDHLQNEFIIVNRFTERIDHCENI